MESLLYYEVFKIHLDIQSPGFPSDTGPGKACKWKFVTAPGAQVMVNFKTFDMLKPLDSECSRQEVILSDSASAFHSPTGGKSLSFCGDLVPNYPGPSTFTSGTYYVLYFFSYL